MHRLLFVVAVGCGGGSGGTPADIDAAPVPDSPEIVLQDAPVLAGNNYVIASQLIPQNNAQVSQTALDLDDNLSLDNKLGGVTVLFSGMGFNSQVAATNDVDRGLALSLVAFAAGDFTNGPATFTLFTGANPNPPACANANDSICRQHLSGFGIIEVAATSAHDTPLAGTLVNGTFVSDPGPNSLLQIQTDLATGGVVTLNLVGARAKVTMASATGIMSGSVAGAVTSAEVTSKLIPAWQQILDAAIFADCMELSCVCVAGSKGEQVRNFFEHDGDCRITLAELTASTLLQAQLAPDVVIDGQPALSLAIGFSAVPATVTQ